MPPKPPRVLTGKYQLESLLGQGGMGEVWQATDLILDRPVAVKLLRARMDDHDLQEARNRFRREGQAAARLRHPSITIVYEMSEDDGQLFLVFELLPGQDLGKLLASQPSGLPVAQVLDIGAKVAAGLAYAHEQGVVHRDVKPSNLMLLSDGSIRICDFGLAQLANVTSKLTTGKAPLISLDYMPPERLKGQEVTGSADVYSMGATLFELLCGRTVFPSDDRVSVMGQHLFTAPPDPRTLRADCPADLSELVHAMLGKDPGERPTAADLAAKFADLLDQASQEQAAPPQPDEAFDLDPPPVHRRPAAPPRIPDLLRRLEMLGEDQEQFESLLNAAHEADALTPEERAKSWAVISGDGWHDTISRNNSFRSADLARIFSIVVIPDIAEQSAAGAIAKWAAQAPAPMIEGLLVAAQQASRETWQLAMNILEPALAVRWASERYLPDLLDRDAVARYGTERSISGAAAGFRNPFRRR